MNKQQIHSVKTVSIDPSALGLFGLAMITLVASSEKLGITEGTSLLLPWAFFLGGILQLFASYLDAKINNVFGAVAFGAYGFFWIAVGMSWMIQMGALGETLLANADGQQLGFAFLGYLIFSVFLTIGAAETHKVLFVDFIVIDILLLSLTLMSFGVMPDTMKFIAGLSELIIALISFYGAAAAVLNPHFGRVFLPVGKPLGKLKAKPAETNKAA